MIVDRAIYRGGRRTLAPESPAELNASGVGGEELAWIDLYRSDEREFADVAREFDLHELAIKDAVKEHQRPKLDRYGDSLLLVLRPARYVDETETVEFGEVDVLAGPRFVITVAHSDIPDLAAVRHSVEARPDLLGHGSMAVVHAILDRVVDDYVPVVAGVQKDIDEIEDDVFDGSPTVSRRIYELAREVIWFQRAIKPLGPILEQLMNVPEIGEEARRYIRAVHDHALRLAEQTDAFRELLQNILSVNLTLETKALSETGNAQNEQVKKISAWAAILFAPTVIGTIYGMNFDHMPELHWLIGYPLALGLMVLICVSLYMLFKRRDWI